MDDPQRIERASAKLESIEEYSSIPYEIERDVEKAVAKRTAKLGRNRTIDDFHETEINTRYAILKEAHRKLCGELRAFVEASYRHDKV